jgi:hypothetical protein
VRRVESQGFLWLEPEAFGGGGGTRACFSTRRGGYSSGAYAHLNMGMHVGDDEIAVASSRLAFWSALGLDPESAVGMRQVHGARVMIVTAADRGRGAASWTHALADTDGLITLERGVPIFGLSADCCLVALAAPDRRGVAVLHAGWRGLVGGIVPRGAGLLAGLARVEPGALTAFVGPALCGGCFEVRDDFVGSLVGAWGRGRADRLLTRAGDRRFFRYEAAVMEELELAGLRRDGIETAGGCTAEESGLFYSHRASGGRTGRMAMTVWMPE